MKKRKILKFTVNFALSVIFLISGLILKSYSPSQFTFNPDVKVQRLADGRKLIKGFSNDEFQLYYVDKGEEVVPYAFVKKFGVWIWDYPNKRNICGLTFGKKDVYYYGKFALNDMYDFIENAKEGNRIYGHKTKTGEHIFCVYQIPYSDKENICYRFVDSDNIINDETLFLDGVVSLYKRQNGKDIIQERTIRQLKQEQMDLWALIEQTIESADKNLEIPDGRVYQSETSYDAVWQIYVNYETGHFLNIEKGKKGYDWAGRNYYNIELKGQHPNTISIRSVDYSEVSLFKEFNGELRVHPVTIPIGLEEYFKEL